MTRTLRRRTATQAGIIRELGGPNSPHGHASGKWHYFVSAPLDGPSRGDYKAHSEKDARRVARSWDYWPVRCDASEGGYQCEMKAGHEAFHAHMIVWPQ